MSAALPLRDEFDGPGLRGLAKGSRDPVQVRRLAGAQERQDRFARAGLEDVDRLEAVFIVIGVEEGQLLLAMGGIGGLVDIQGDGLGHPDKGVAEEIDHGEPHACQIAPGSQVLQARERGLAHQIPTALRQPATG